MRFARQRAEFSFNVRSLGLKPSLRFSVLARDKFRCRYCGASAPDVTLHVDHIVPRSREGANDASNLITACADCNLGKSDRLLPTELAGEIRSAEPLRGERERQAAAHTLVPGRRGIKTNTGSSCPLARVGWSRGLTVRTRSCFFG